MTKADFSDEILMRFADGELDQETVARIKQALEMDDDLLARVALFTETRAQAQLAMKPLLEENVPDHLVAAVQRMVDEKRARSTDEQSAGNVVPLRKPAAEPLSARTWALPIAASLATAVLGGLAGYWLSSNSSRPAHGLQVAGVSSPALIEALATRQSGGEIQLAGTNQRLRLIATFRDSQKALCREFEVDSPNQSTVISVACHAGDEWRVSFAVVALGDSNGYAPASSTEALDAYLSAIHAEAPMSAEEELNALQTMPQRPSS
ncbi:anti-sigma factor [Mesorhizobium sp. YR577]|uniref:anti-sigma factor family protein n=1 Tax=Mesorhizobium sp. YR577 TaxID=1884373 RepID=UPI0008E8B8E6|nr:anti-sigma factor [Mesorhizobium sp. YR577]SFU23160.1 Transmembrane transcriptional regulator (anti-sigma factor RsiW) [Mesorhizobium sp. YR577]